MPDYHSISPNKKGVYHTSERCSWGRRILPERRCNGDRQDCPWCAQEAELVLCARCPIDIPQNAFIVAVTLLAVALAETLGVIEAQRPQAIQALVDALPVEISQGAEALRPEVRTREFDLARIVVESIVLAQFKRILDNPPANQTQPLDLDLGFLNRVPKR